MQWGLSTLFGRREDDARIPSDAPDRPAVPESVIPPPGEPDPAEAEWSFGPALATAAFGAYSEDGWEHFPTQQLWVKRLFWHADVRSTVTGQILRLEYYAAAVAEERDYRHRSFVLQQESEAWRDLNRMVKLAADGKGFLPPATRDGCMEKALHTELMAWRGSGNQVPDDAEARVQAAMKNGADVYEAHALRLLELGGDPDSPMNNEIGWYVPISIWREA